MTRRRRPEFLIYAPTWGEELGGVIALHALCDRLNSLGYAAALWPWNQPAGLFAQKPKLGAGFEYLLRREWRFFDTGPFHSPIARWSDLKGAVVVYPEIVAGNPLGADHVVRWLLHKPGYHNGLVEFGPDDLAFYYERAFDTADVDGMRRHELRVTYMHPAYRQTNFGPRHGSCVLFRKGKDRKLDRHPRDAIVVDEMGHVEAAAVFNSTEVLYSYDLYSYFTIVAAVCGCTPVIIPEEGLSRQDWHSDPRDSYGRAYGEQEIERARNERPLLIQRLAEVKAFEDEMVERFVSECRAHFKTGAA